MWTDLTGPKLCVKLEPPTVSPPFPLPPPPLHRLLPPRKDYSMRSKVLLRKMKRKMMELPVSQNATVIFVKMMFGFIAETAVRSLLTCGLHQPQYALSPF